jgi:glycerol-3-phosphate cytidylyltransferase-like family protein
MLQARQLGTELLVGVHSDEAIMENKGPTVMRLDERCVLGVHVRPSRVERSMLT